MQDRTLVDDEAQEAVVRRSFSQIDEEGELLDDLICLTNYVYVQVVAYLVHLTVKYVAFNYLVRPYLHLAASEM